MRRDNYLRVVARESLKQCGEVAGLWRVLVQFRLFKTQKESRSLVAVSYGRVELCFG